MFNLPTIFTFCCYSSSKLHLSLPLLLLSVTFCNAQTVGKTALFKKQTLNELQQNPPKPQQSTFQSITIAPIYQNPILGSNSIEQQNRIILQQQGMLPEQNPKQRELQQVKQELREDELKERENQRLLMARPFQNNFQEFLKMNPDSFSITKAIYLCESAWYDNPPTWHEFENAIKERADLAKQILKREGLNIKNNTAINYAIQKLYKQSNQFTNPKTKQSYTVARLGYDFNDFMGEKNWSNMFVTKLLISGKGQCHSLPLLYLAIAEQLGSRAYLSLSPEHSFIQFFDKNGGRYNFETTNGHLVTQAWLMQSNFINATALKNRTYLDTLSSKRLYAQLLSDLLQNYINKVGYDEIARQMTSKILSFDSKNVAALMTESNFNTFIASQKLKEAGNPPLVKLHNYPDANQAYQKMQRSYQAIEQTGFQEMPKEVYQQWLQTVEQEKKNQENLKIQKRMKEEVNRSKKSK